MALYGVRFNRTPEPIKTRTKEASMSAVKPTLITAFKTWGTIAANVTQQIVEEMEGELSQIGSGVAVAVLDVRYKAVDDFIKRLDTSAYFNIISLEIMSQTAPPIRFETIARRCDFKPDDAGCTPQFPKQERADIAVLADDEKLLKLSNDKRLAAYSTALSDQAGAYLCEYLYYRILERTRTQNSDARAVFIHVSNDDKDTKKQFLRDYLSAVNSLDNLGI
jgi:pyrrolidone-carboxylate peptidase